MTWPANRTPQHLRDSDAAAGFEVAGEFQRFSQMNDIFTRAFWDDRVRSADSAAFFASYRTGATPRRGDGFTQADFALRNAAWLISDIISERNADRGEREGFQAPIRPCAPVAETQADLGTPATAAAAVKKVARLFGADLVGITDLDLRWHYADRPDVRTMRPVPNDLPPDLTHVIVLGHAMDYALVETYPSALAGAATGREYSHEVAIVMQLATWLRNLGYQAVASMNDTALVIPYAIKAGLGEYGRNQMVLTPEFGPRVRFSKIFTNLALATDGPKPLGLTAYCANCTACAAACPVRALPFGPPIPGRRSRPAPPPHNGGCGNGHQMRKRVSATGQRSKPIAPSACASARSTEPMIGGGTACGAGLPRATLAHSAGAWRNGSRPARANAPAAVPPTGGAPPDPHGHAGPRPLKLRTQQAGRAAHRRV